MKKYEFKQNISDSNVNDQRLLPLEKVFGDNSALAD